MSNGHETKNPGNISPAGKVKVYSSYEEGYRELASLLLRNYHGKTLHDVIYMYAPPHENNSAKYVRDFIHRMKELYGYDMTADTVMDFTNPDLVKATAKTISFLEHSEVLGGEKLADETIDAYFQTPEAQKVISNHIRASLSQRKGRNTNAFRYFFQMDEITPAEILPSEQVNLDDVKAQRDPATIVGREAPTRQNNYNNPFNLPARGQRRGIRHFDSLEDGYITMAHNLHQNYNGYSLNGIWRKFAGPGADPTNFVKEARKLGLNVDPNTPLDLSNPMLLECVTLAMAKERGKGSALGGDLMAVRSIRRYTEYIAPFYRQRRWARLRNAEHLSSLNQSENRGVLACFNNNGENITRGEQYNDQMNLNVKTR